MLNQLFIPQLKNKYKPYLLRKTALVFYSILLLLVNYTSLIFPSEISKVQASEIASDTLINLTNQDRQKYGLPILKQNLALNTAAFAKANDMFNKQYWDHFGPNGETPWQFIKASGYQYVYAGENLAKGFQTSEGVEQAWMASPTHRENILSPNYQEIGIAVVTGDLKGEYVVLVVQMFGNVTTSIYEQNQNTRGLETTDESKVTENGDIKSIKFTSLENNSVITNPNIDIKGKVDFVDTIKTYNVGITLNSKELAQVSSDSNEWVYVSDRNYLEGANTLSASITGINGVTMKDELLTDKIEFVVDSTPPKFDIDNVKFSLSNSTQIRVVSTVSEKDVLLKLVIDQAQYGFTLDDASKQYVTYVDLPTDFINANIFISDKYGNTDKFDVTSKLRTFMVKNLDTTQASKDEVGFSGLVGNLFSIFSAKDITNLLIAIFVLALLLIEINYYRKQGRLHERFHSVAFVAIWIMSIFFAVTGNMSGRII
jgi:uncharacterized protein YkwD